MKIPFFSQPKNLPATRVPGHTPADPLDIIFHYHEQTKHHYFRFARSLGYLDWDTQPDPFRVFEGAPRFRLPLMPVQDHPGYDEIFESGAIQADPLDLNSLSRFLLHSLAISAWKRYGDARWALRVNPSSGNLHPTEGYVVLGKTLGDLAAGVYHYSPRDHSLEQRCVFDSNEDNRAGFLVGLTSIHWREAWKYGERAYRYCQHDLGHAIAALRISAAVRGWKMTVLAHLTDAEVADVLGLNRVEDFHEAEDEFPAILAAIEDAPEAIPRPGVWHGHANRLSTSHVEWEIIDHVANAGVKFPLVDKERVPERLDEISRPVVTPSLVRTGNSAEKIIQQRRSCLALDGVTSITQETLFGMLGRTLPGSMPFDCFRQEAFLHLAIFVHRVRTLQPGLYMLVRSSDKLDLLRERCKPEFRWEQCNENLPLYLLEAGDFRKIATGVSCGQDIAGDGAFSLGMIAEFVEPIKRIGPWFYRRLFWESGMIGQVLYLEAEAAGIRSTGIGCFFDDPMHELLGLKDNTFQSLYHFTVGGPVEDQRLTTEPPYESDGKN